MEKASYRIREGRFHQIFHERKFLEKSTPAAYFDNKGHVIPYAASVSPDSITWTFLSEAQAGAPRFRLIYTKETENALRLDFDIAPTGKPEVFSSYIRSRLWRK